LLAWWDTRGRLAFFCFAGLSIAGVVLVATGLYLREDDAAAEGEEVAIAAEIPPGETPVVEPTPTPTPLPTPIAIPAGDAASSNDAFVVEAASEPGAFDRPTSFTLDDAGNLYVGFEAGIRRARDRDGDGFYEDVSHFGYDGGWVFGLDFYEGSLYAAIDGSLMRFTDEDGDGVADEQTTMLSGLPQDHYGGHSNSGLIVADDGLIYMTVGGTSDHGPELNPLGGTILTMPVDGGGAVDIYARGFRNPYDIAFCPDGRLYASDNGPDSINDDVDETAPDEVNLVLEGRNYGYPDYFGPQDPSTGTESPIAQLPLRAGATGIVCHDGSGLPQAYAGNLFVTMWGTFTSPVETGKRVMRVEVSETDEGEIFGTVTQFAVGFGHPIDILQEPDGGLLVLDFEHGQLFRIRYTGSAESDESAGSEGQAVE
jgi:glucose/arabinose dehydrogenase